MTKDLTPQPARSSPQPLPEGVREREDFEAWYSADAAERGLKFSPADVAGLRCGEDYGSRAYLNGCWIGWQARALLAHPQGGVGEGIEEGIEGRPELPCADAGPYPRSPDTQGDLDLLGGLVLHLEDGKPLTVGNPLALAGALRRVLSGAFPGVTEAVYLSAVKGRADFRSALRAARSEGEFWCRLYGQALDGLDECAGDDEDGWDRQAHAEAVAETLRCAAKAYRDGEGRVPSSTTEASQVPGSAPNPPHPHPEVNVRRRASYGVVGSVENLAVVRVEQEDDGSLTAVIEDDPHPHPESVNAGLVADDEMKPCPFCGGEAHPDSANDCIAVVCVTCGAEGPWTDDASSAVEAWNRRDPIAKAQAHTEQDGAGSSDGASE